MLKKTSIYWCIQIWILYSKMAMGNPILGEAYPARADEFPFIVSLSYSSNIPDKNNHICGGALISKRHVLTAEHCLRDDQGNDLFPDEVRVIIGSINLEKGHRYRVDSWITYRDWALLHNHKVTAAHDIAIVTLMRDVEDIEPAKISTLNDREVMGKEVVTAGWGVIDKDKDIVPDSLLKVNLKVLNTAQARMYHYKLFGNGIEPKKQFYYTSTDSSAVLSCGDSGGPLLLVNTTEIVGVNKGTCNIDKPLSKQYAMSKHLKLRNELKEFIEDVKNSVLFENIQVIILK